MNLLRRLNLFWLGAGGLLVVFCGNEVVAFHTMKVRLWLGGPMIYVSMLLGLLLGLLIMAFLGVEEELEPGDLVAPQPEAAPGAGAEPAGAELAESGAAAREGLASGAASTEAV